MTPESNHKHDSSKKKKKPRKLVIGQNISSTRGEYTIVQLLGSGGFGDVYKVKREKEGEMYAMKTEYNVNRKNNKKLDRLKVEMAVLNDIMDCKEEERKKHFLKLVDRGRTEELKFIVMTLVWYSFDILRSEFLETISWSTIFKIAIQSLQSIEDLHLFGYLHRDIKPHNFAIGCPPLDNNLYMIDYGIARRYREKDGKIRIPRQSVKFLGTLRFASRTCHNEKEQGRKDDLESWIYFILDIFNPLNLTWRQESDRQKVLESKHKLLTKPDTMKIDAPEVFGKIISYVNSLQYPSDPDYDIIKEYLKIGAKDENCNINKNFDWVGVTLIPKKKKKEVENDHISDDDDLWTDEKMNKKRDDKRRKDEDLDQTKSLSDDETPKKKNVRLKRSVPAVSGYSQSPIVISGVKGRNNSLKLRQSHGKPRSIKRKVDKASEKRIVSSNAGTIGVNNTSNQISRREKDRQK